MHPIYRCPKNFRECLSTTFAEIFNCSYAVLLWGCEPQSWKREGSRGSEMVSFERALVSSYRPSIVTFHLSLRVSEILPLLCSSTSLFPPHLYDMRRIRRLSPKRSLPKTSPRSPRSRWMTFGLYEERICWANCPFSFRYFLCM